MNRPQPLAARTAADGLDAYSYKYSHWARHTCKVPDTAPPTRLMDKATTSDFLESSSTWISGSALINSSLKSRCVNRMAGSRLKNLVCFYCNGKSHRKQDGTVRQWDCKRCDATNYLDENGEITDPPTSTTENNSSTSFALPIAPPEWSNASSQDSVFCDKCIKNHHLYRSSLAQYLPGETHPDYERSLENLDNFKAELENRYPQVCENCVERVQSKMKRALYSAKADAHGRLLERTRRNGGPGAKPRTWLEFMHSIGGTAWAWGIYLQIACLVVLLIYGVAQNATELVDDDSSPLPEADSTLAQSMQSLVELAASFLFSIPETFMTAVPAAAKASLVLSMGSIWWNPQWRFTRKQNLNIVFGLYDWYSQQGILLFLRLLAWGGRGSWLFSHAEAPMTMAIRAFILAFTIWISIYSTRKVTVKPRKLFAPAPDRETLLPKRKNSSTASPRKSNTLLDALESLNDEPAIPSSPVTPTTTINYASPESQRRDGAPFRNQSQSPTKSRGIASITNKISPFENSPRSTGDADPDEMEWTPTVSQHRAFNSGMSAQRNSQSFNNAPSCPERSVFWFKVPPAPMTPARKLRNPPVQPLLAAPSLEAKENFFRKTSDRHSASFGDRKPRRDYTIAQPTFFPPGADADDTGLADLLGKSFNISDSEDSEADVDGHVTSRRRPKKKVAPPGRIAGLKRWLGM